MLKISVENKLGTAEISKYAYTNDAAGRRTDVVMTGTAFSGSTFNKYDYNNRSEVTGGNKYQGIDINDTSNPVSAYDFGYAYDPIGNRLTSRTGILTDTYTSNAINQYTNITNLPTSPTYDADGNTTTDGSGWTYTWDAENRLKSISKDNQTIELKYDYMFRRIEKKVSASSIIYKKEYYIYDRFKQIVRLNSLNNNVIAEKIIWRNEVLLSIIDAESATTYYCLSDACKNITELINETGNIVAHYEYDPFGKVTFANGSYASANHFRFSSEYIDDETNLIYYNYRYYNPNIGKWLNRDQIVEQGGINLYCFSINNTINHYDILGLAYCAAWVSYVTYKIPIYSGGDYTDWYKSRFPKTKDHVDKLFENKINDLISSKGCAGNKISNSDLPVFSIDGYPTGERRGNGITEDDFGDKGQWDGYEAALSLGNYRMITTEFHVCYKPSCDPNCKQDFSWTATITVVDGLGINPGNVNSSSGVGNWLLFKGLEIGVFGKERPKNVASWTISNGGCCKKNE